MSQTAIDTGDKTNEAGGGGENAEVQQRFGVATCIIDRAEGAFTDPVSSLCLFGILFILLILAKPFTFPSHPVVPFLPNRTRVLLTATHVRHAGQNRSSGPFGLALGKAMLLHSSLDA